MGQHAAIRFLLLIAVGLPMALPAAGCKAKKAGLTIKQRLEKAEKETTPDRQAAALLKVARSQFAAGDEAAAKETATKAFERLKGEGDPNLFTQRLIDVGGFLADIGERKPAREAVGLAVGLADKIDDQVRKTQLLADAGAIYKAARDSQAAKDTL